MRRSVKLLPSCTREALFLKTGKHILTVDDYNGFINGWEGCSDQDEMEAMREGYYGA